MGVSTITTTIFSWTGYKLQSSGLLTTFRRANSNSNIITATCWYILELAKDPELLSRIRAEATDSMSQPDGSTSAVDAGRLSTQPLIQSGYAEVLRLHTYNFLVTTSKHSDFTFRKWRFPKNQMVAFSSHTAHNDDRVWNVRSRTAEHPLNGFWAERFLIRESDPRSGPLSPEYRSSLKAKGASDQDESDDIERNDSSRALSPQSKSLKFSLAGLGGIWAPFGGGYSLCPGQHLAKEEILVAVAEMVLAFDFKLVEKKRSWWKSLTSSSVGDADRVGYRHDMRYFGMGVLPPKEKVKVMIRRRDMSEVICSHT